MEPRNTHANSSCNCKRVHYADNAEMHEDNPVEGDNYSGTSDISKTSVKYSGDANSEISIATSILDIEDLDVRTLKRRLEEYECKMSYLENENKKINEDLLNERKRTTKLEKKLQFVKDNQEVFMRLKEAYINMKYNEAAGRKMIEIREKGMQTWEGTICSSCIESEELRRQIDILIQKYSELFVVSPGEMEHLMNTVKYLKDLIDRREESWTYCMNRDNKLQGLIAMLEDENAKLREVIANKGNEDVPGNIVEEVKLEQQLLEERKIEEMQKFIEGVTKELERLKKMIIKYEKQFREIKEHHPGKYISALNDKEIKIVQQIITKYNAKVQKKNMEEVVRSRSPSNGSERTRQCRRPSSPLRSSRDTSVRRAKTPERPNSIKQFDKRTDSSILMMDYLFD